MNHSNPPSVGPASAAVAAASGAAGAAPPPLKPIRFVTNHDGPYAKRRRINSACLTCRRKKTRCSGERPVCGTCSQNKHECGGYGPETDTQNHVPASPTIGADTKDGPRKLVRRDSSDVGSSAHRRVKVEPTAQSFRPPLQHTRSGSSTHSHRSEAEGHGHGHDNGHGRAHGHQQHRPEMDTETSRGPSVDHGSRTPGQALSLATRNRMPYFRYFGPTAIMPGFKQMVVKVRGKQHSTGHTSSDALDSSPGQPATAGLVSPPTEARTPLEIPVYDTSAMSPSPLITHLCKVFFAHLGCNFPFLQKERFMRDLEEKQVDAILVDAVCALAARFSNHPMLTGAHDGQKEGPSTNDGGAESPNKTQPSEHGQAFAQRAKSAIPDAFPCPSVAVVQAALLLAYDEFGASRDSGLWMYLGIAIRMAQDLGMQTLEGLRYEGRDGPTPKSVKTTSNVLVKQAPKPPFGARRKSSSDPAAEEQRAVERERLDTFWAIFFLDRVISSGTGRPVTLRDKDIEISFPSLDEVDPVSGLPLPFPALIRIVHLYGRVTDLLNSVKEKEDITDDFRKQLDTMEFHLTAIYQGLSPQLHFNALNFQQYAKMNQGTNFALLHCWFHTLIVLLHQPTLLKTFEENIPLFSSNSRELSMSSAKTVADILAFTELIDAKTGIGNPFTSQPIYIAACAFLKESALHTASSNPHSRPSTPGPGHHYDPSEIDGPSVTPVKLEKHSSNGDKPSHLDIPDQKQAAKHTLLASAAKQNYQRCYRALKSLEPYWAGVKYILTVLDQKAKGVVDPLLYTQEEIESSLEQPRPEPAFTSPGWRRKLSWGTYLTAQNVADVAHASMPSSLRNKTGARTPNVPGSPMAHPTQAIGWSLTGTMNSPSTSLAVLYPNNATRETEAPRSADKATPSIASVLANSSPNMPMGPSNQGKYENGQHPRAPTVGFPARRPSQSYNPASSGITSMPPPSSFPPVQNPDPVLVSEADLLLNLHSPFSTNSPNSSRIPNPAPFSSSSRPGEPIRGSPNQDFSPGGTQFSAYPTPTDANPNQVPFTNMTIESQDIDMSTLGDDMMPWLEYLPHDIFGQWYENPAEFGDALQ